jgi:ribosome recycling factor
LNDGKILRVPIPELTEERRRELVKHIRKMAEDYRVSIRNHRRDAIDLLKSLQKDKEITEDDLHRAQEKAQEITKMYIERIDQVLKTKEDEIMEV